MRRTYDYPNRLEKMRGIGVMPGKISGAHSGKMK